MSKIKSVWPESDQRKIYKMKLHDMIDLGPYCITRVPGGWIYATNRPGSEIFIPFHNEFQKT